MGQIPVSEGRHVKGTSLAIKLSVAITMLVLVFMLVFALFLRSFVHDTMRDQVIRTAKEAARAGAQAELAAWELYYGTPYQGMAKAEIQAIVDQWTPEQYENRFLTPDQRQQLEWNRKRLQRFSDENSLILEVDIVSQDRRTILATSMVGGSTKYEPTKESARDDDEFAEEGYLTYPGTQRLFVVRGQAPVLDKSGHVAGYFGVYIDARNIVDATSAFMLTVSYAAALFILLGAALSFVMGRRITRPLTKLQEDIRVVAGGDLEHHTVPHSSDEIGQLARTFDHMTKTLRVAQEQERETAAAQHQMTVAGEVTDRLFPDDMPMVPGYDMGGHHEVAGAVGGEYYDVLVMDGGRIGFLIAAASGTGIPAAMVMAMTRSYLKEVAHHEQDPGVVLRRVNELMAGELREGMYVSVLLAVLDPDTGRVCVANAGHAPLITWRRSTGKIAAQHSEGIALGFDSGPVFDRTLKVLDVDLEPGDRIVLLCAGVGGLQGAEGGELGDRRFLGLIQHEAEHPSGQFVKRVAALLAKFRGKQPLSVDVTLLTLRRQ